MLKQGGFSGLWSPASEFVDNWTEIWCHEGCPLIPTNGKAWAELEPQCLDFRFSDIPLSYTALS